MNTLQALWRVTRALWNIGVPFARTAIRVVFGLIVVWPFVLLGTSFTGSAGIIAAVALVPLAAVFLLILIYPLVSGVLVAFPQGRTFYLWLAVVLFGEILIGLYLAVVPVWNNPGLIPVLALLVVVLGMFLILKRQFGFRQGWWFTTAVALAILVVTVAFFFSGKSEEEVAEAAVQTSHIEKFTLNAGEEKLTVLVKAGTFHRIQANKLWTAVGLQLDGTLKEFKMPAGPSSWQVRKEETREGLLLAKGLEDGTTLRFERIR